MNYYDLKPFVKPTKPEPDSNSHKVFKKINKEGKLEIYFFFFDDPIQRYKIFFKDMDDFYNETEMLFKDFEVQDMIDYENREQFDYKNRKTEWLQMFGDK